MKRIIPLLFTIILLFSLISCNESQAVTAEYTCTVTVSCKELIGCDALDINKRELVPEDGIIVAAREVKFSEGESAFDVLSRVLREERIHFEFNSTPMYGTSYIEGICNIYEFDAGATSGWVYTVNGVSPNIGSSSYILSDGDVIEWTYTLEGRGIG